MTGPGDLQASSAWRGLALTLRFLLELALLAGAAIAAWATFDGAMRIVWAILVPAAVAVVWGLFLSPKAALPVHWALRLAIEAMLFLGVALWLHAHGYTLAAAVGAGLWALDRFGLWVIGRRAVRGRPRSS